MDPLQWMGAVRMRVQTADKNITIIRTPQVHNSMSCEKLRVCIKSIKVFLILNHCFQLKYESVIHDNASSSYKAIPSESREKFEQIKHQTCSCILIWENNRELTFSLESIINNYVLIF